MNKSLFVASFLGVTLVAVIVALILTFGGEQESKESYVGVVLPGSASELGWNGTHYKGVSDAAQELGTKILLAENAHEKTGAAVRAIDSLVEAGASMIILVSYNYAKEVAETMRKYPKVMFYSQDADIKEDNYRVYFARVYQARYLSGLIAGRVTRSNKVGYVAAMSNDEVNRGINAFALGVRKTNPKAQVFVAWTNSWDDAEVERANVRKLVEQKQVDFIAYHQNQGWVPREAELLGIPSIGYNLDSSGYSPLVMSSVSTHWKMVYKELIQDFLQKKQSINNYWVGIEKSAVGLTFYSSAVDDSSKAVVEDAILQMQNGMEVFKGPISDNQGKKRCGKDEVLSDSFLRENMDWFVDGVNLYEE